MKKYLFSISIIAVSFISQAQSFGLEEYGIDSTEFMAKFDSAVKSNPDFGYTILDSTLLMMQLLSPEEMEKVLESVYEEFEQFDPYEHISAHMEGGWELAAESSDPDEYYLVKAQRGDKYWVKKLTKSYNNEYYKSNISLMKINCQEGKLGLVQTTEYDEDGKVLDSVPARDDYIVSMEYAVPDTVGEALVESACK